MGQYNKKITSMPDKELIEISLSIDTYNSEFIDDYLKELDIRKKLWEIIKLLDERKTIIITYKLESIPNSKYYTYLKSELVIRDLISKYETYKKEQKKIIENNKEESKYFIKTLITIVMICGLFFKYCNTKNEQKNDQKKHNNHKLDAIKNNTNEYDYQKSIEIKIQF